MHLLRSCIFILVKMQTSSLASSYKCKNLCGSKSKSHFSVCVTLVAHTFLFLGGKMLNRQIERGFITIATGNIHYYEIATNLLRSYRCFCENPLPFAILCDCENNYTQEFDETILCKNCSSSYVDKLLLLDASPFLETIFIDADCLAFSNLNDLFDIFAHADDFSCLGNIMKLDEKSSGWFTINSFPKTTQNPEVVNQLKAKQLPYSVGIHGGIYFFRKTELTKQVFLDAKNVIKHYNCYSFRVFDNPADEPAFALAMAMNNCKPIPYSEYALSCYWNTKLDMCFNRGFAKRTNGIQVPLVHFGTRYTMTPFYNKQIEQMNFIINNMSITEYWYKILKCNIKILCFCIKQTNSKIILRLSRINMLKKIWHFVKND